MNSADDGPPAEAAFISGPAGEIFTLFYSPQIDVAPPARVVLIVPPFAEEMNKSRRMFSLLARELTLIGYGVLLIDLYGTGDSQGDFGQARWANWKGDVLAAIDRLLERGMKELSLLGLRLGALLAVDVTRECMAKVDMTRLVLWHPVTSGQSVLTQFLRLRLAASMMDSAKEKETTGQLRRILFEERLALEVAGYELAPEMALAIDALNIADLFAPEFPPVHWLEVIPSEGRPMSPASRKVLDACAQQVGQVNAATVVGDPFWTLPEITLTPALLSATVEVFRRKARDVA